jgi:hypothetical protein
MPSDSAVLRDKKKLALGLATFESGSPPGPDRIGLASEATLHGSSLPCRFVEHGPNIGYHVRNVGKLLVAVQQLELAGRIH